MTPCQELNDKDLLLDETVLSEQSCWPALLEQAVMP